MRGNFLDDPRRGSCENRFDDRRPSSNVAVDGRPRAVCPARVGPLSSPATSRRSYLIMRHVSRPSQCWRSIRRWRETPCAHDSARRLGCLPRRRPARTEPPQVSRRSLCGLQLSVESGVVTLLELDGRNVSQARVEPFIVVPLDPGGGGVLDVGERLVRPDVEDRRADAHSAR